MAKGKKKSKGKSAKGKKAGISKAQAEKRAKKARATRRRNEREKEKAALKRKRARARAESEGKKTKKKKSKAKGGKKKSKPKKKKAKGGGKKKKAKKKKAKAREEEHSMEAPKKKKKKAKKKKAKKSAAKRKTPVCTPKRAEKLAASRKKAVDRRVAKLEKEAIRQGNLYSKRLEKARAEAAEAKKHKKHKKHGKHHVRAFNPIEGWGQGLAAFGGVAVGALVTIFSDRYAVSHALSSGNMDQPSQGQLYNADAINAPIWSSMKRLAFAGADLIVPFGVSMATKKHPKTQTFFQAWFVAAGALLLGKTLVDVNAALFNKGPKSARLFAPEITAKNALAISKAAQLPAYQLVPGGSGPAPGGNTQTAGGVNPGSTMLGAVDANGQPLQVANPGGSPPIPANNPGVANPSNPTAGFPSPPAAQPTPGPQMTSTQAAQAALAAAAAGTTNGGMTPPSNGTDGGGCMPACAYQCDDCDAAPGCGPNDGDAAVAVYQSMTN